MALSTTITTKSVTTTMDGLYTLTLNMKYADGATVLIDRDFSENYWTGMAFSVAFFNFKEHMKKAISDYKAEQAILAGGGLGAIVTNLNNVVGT